MRKEGRIQNFIIALFGIAIVAMSVGFALYTTTLTIGGGNGTTANATFTPTKWSVHYDGANKTITQTTGYVAPTSITIPTPSETDIQFAVTLSRPGDKCQFTVPVVNDGSFDAYLNSVIVSNPNLPFVSWKITYDGDDYTPGTYQNIDNKMLPYQAGNNDANRKPLVVYVEYLLPADETDLPTTSNQTVYFNASLVFNETDSPGA